MYFGLGYDVFGLKRFTKDELLRRTDYTYDAADRLTQVQRAARVGGSYNTKRATDSYTYDAAGNRISHTATPDGAALYTDKTYFDALGRITKGVSAENRTTTMTYAWDSTLKGAGGAAVGGWKKTTSNGLTGTKQNAADTSTLPTTITATVDAVNIFGQTVSHTDLGGRVYTYTYNLAGWLTGQSSTAGQSIGYEYYANGYIKKTVDNATGAWTEYGYDKVGNRTYEAYSRMVGGLGGNRVYEQNARISYDELNRVKFIDDLRANITYEYDAQSNRRRVWSVYQDGVYGYESTQEYWYTYDSMNRFLVTRGSLAARASTEGGAATILATGVDGVKVAYDKAGQRTQAIYGLDGHREDYTYTADGLVENTYINATSASQGALRASRTNDLMGRVGAYTEYDTNGTTVTRNRTTTFDKDNRQTGQTETYKGTTSTTVNTLLADGTLSKVVTTGGTTTTLNYAYEWWDSAKQSRITEQAYNPALGMNNNLWKPGVSHYTYDVNGHLLGAIDEQLNKSFTYVNNAQGQVMLREQRDAGTLKQTHRYYYAEGKAVGDVGNDGDTNVDYATQLADTSSTGNTYTDRQNAYKNWRPVSSADFDQNYQAITASYPGTAPGSYVVQAGDSLYSIAASQWGDASLWYLIAEANGLSGASSLTAGQTLSIPNKVTNVHNSSSTSGVYDAGKTMGDTSPTIPDAPPPPQQDKGGCGALAMIIVIVVAAVVTGGVGLALAGTSTGLAAAGAWAVAGAVGSIASQGVAMAMGVQQDFSWKAVGVSALGAAVTAGLGGAPSSGGAGATGASQSSFMNLTGWQAAAARAATASVITQGVGSVLGISSFSWRSVAASAAGAGMSTALGETRWMDAVNPFDAGTDAAKIFNGTAGGMVNGGVQAGIFDTKPNWGSIAAQSFGSALGDSFTQQKVAADADRSSARDENTDFSLSGARLGQSGRSGLRLGTGDAGDSVAYESDGGRAWNADVAGRRTNVANAWSADAPALTDVKVNPGSVYVQQGDGLTSVARRYLGDGATAGEVNAFKNQLAAANPQLGDLNKLQPGQELNLPGGDTRVDGAALAKLAAADRQYIAQRTPVVAAVEEPVWSFKDELATAADQRLEAGRRIYAEALERAPNMTAGGGVESYERLRANIGAALALPVVVGSVGGYVGASTLATLGRVYTTVGPAGTAGLGFATGGGLDAAGQLRQNGTVRWEQSTFAGVVGAISGPVGATSGLTTNVVLGGAGAVANTTFNNYYFKEDSDLLFPGVLGAGFGAGGYFVGSLTTKFAGKVIPEVSYPNLNRQVPLLFQAPTVSRIPGVVGVTAGGVTSGVASFIPAPLPTDNK